MAVNWNMAVGPDTGTNIFNAFQQGQQQGFQERGRNALTAYAQNPTQANLSNLAQYDPKMVMEVTAKMTEQQRAEVKNRVDMMGQAAQWADTPEKWDQAIDYLTQTGIDVAQYKGKFSPELRMSAISSSGELKSYLDRTAPVNVGPGSHLVDPVTGQVKFSAPFAPRPVTVKDGETVVEYAPGAANGSLDSVWQGMIKTESGGNHFAANGSPLTSPKGALGIAQVMPATAPEAAALAGLPFDENRYRTDPQYNAAIGRAYFEKQVQTFGDVEKAVAAYNAGPGNVQKAIEKGGDNWKQFLPAETKNYLQSVLGPAGSRVIAQGAPKKDKPKDAPAGYRWKADGTLEPIPGGPADKNPNKDPGYSQSAMDAFDRAITTANDLLKHPGFSAAVGSAFDPAAFGSFNPFTGKTFAGTDAADFRTNLDTMKAQVFLPMVQSMKGMGALSNAEGEKLTAAIGNLSTDQSEAQFKKNIQQIINDLTTYKNRAARPAVQGTQPKQAQTARKPSVSNW